MTGDDLLAMGFKPGRTIGIALRLIPAAQAALGDEGVERELRAVLTDPVHNSTHPYFSELAEAIRAEQEKPVFIERPEPAPYQVWGKDIDALASDQITRAVRLI